MLVTIFYKCSCMTAEESFPVVERDPSKNVIQWMEDVVKPGLSSHHRKHHPKCRSRKTEYVKLPTDRVTKVVGRADRAN